MPEDFPSLRESLLAARHVVIFTGAGVSQESGIATFRDRTEGLWARFEPQELATPEAFDRDPALVWAWYEWRRGLIAHAKPNAAHRAIARMQQCLPRLTVITQNVDDLHERAGAENVLHLHGTLAAARCRRCHRPWQHSQVQPSAAAPTAPLSPPDCPHCGNHIRPGVVWFGESLPMATWEAAAEAATDCDMLFSIGTSSLVYPAADLPHQARQRGAMVVQVNPEPTALDAVAHQSLRGKAGDILPTIAGLCVS